MIDDVEVEDSTAPVSGFEALNLPEPLLRVVRELGYETPSPIQVETIPPMLAGRDVLGQAQTGTGKTAAFALPILARIDLSILRPQALVLTPTRELGIQVATALKRYAAGLPGFRVVALYGGQSYEPQLAMLDRGVHVVVGTPGRLIDHLSRGTLDLSRLRHVVLDEADEMLRMGFIDDVEEILGKTPATRQTALFSATLPPPIRRIAQTHMREPVEVTIASRSRTADNIRQRYWLANGMHKLDALTRILEVEPAEGTIVFARTRQATEELASQLQTRGFAALAIHGDVQQSQRERCIAKLRDGAIDILVATDVAARGLDVERITRVVNFDVPLSAESYVHRVGRTGRAGRSGEAILFVAPRERGVLHAIERATRQSIAPLELPTIKMVNAARVEKFKQQILGVVEGGSLEAFREVLADLEREHGIPALDLAAALARMAHGKEPFLLAPPVREGRDSREGRDNREYREHRDNRGFADDSAPARQPDVGMATFRVEVGHAHGVRPGNLVGAVTNEAQIDGKRIGKIQILDDHTLIDLPDDLDPSLIDHLKTVWCAGQQLRITRDGEMPDVPPNAGPRTFPPGTGPRPRKPRPGAPGRPRTGGFRPPARSR